jgi:hypothetical protein
MKRNLSTTLSLVVMSLMLNVAVVHAQSYAKANVPFAFNVGAKQLPAGTYKIAVVGAASNIIMIRNVETGESALSSAKYEAPQSTESKLVFHRIGDQYFFSAVWRESGTAGRSVPTSKRERELTKELRLAKNSTGSHEEVIVALK